MISRIGRAEKQKSKSLTLTLRKKTGLTFVELVLVALIIFVLVGITVPQFKGPFRRIQIKNTSQNLVQLMRYAQAKAIAERKLCRISFSFKEGKFWLSVQEETHPGEFKRIKGRWGKIFETPKGIFIEGESAFINFYPNGSSDETKIEISDGIEKILTVTTQKNIGYVKVEE